MLTILFLQGTFAQKYEANWASLNTRKMPEWFHKDKFGIFIHWGVYAVPAYAPVKTTGDASFSEWYWYWLNKGVKDFVNFHQKRYGGSFEYPQFESMFNAELFDPQQWAGVLKRSGARYVVLTSKHHDGYCLWNSVEADRAWGRPWNAVTGTPKRDLLGDLTNAVREAGMKMGYYYSLYEWFNPLWLRDKKQYVTEHLFPQFKDLVTRYKPALIFSDGDWSLKDTAWKSEELLGWLFNQSPVAKDVVINDRWGSNVNGKYAATYRSSEYGTGLDATVIWEESQGIGHSYGYNRNEQLEDYKTSRHLILMLADVVSRGGNLLLDIGPTADGRIPVIMQQRLADIGAWLAVNGEAIYDTRPFKHACQWSSGKVPERKQQVLWANYNIEELVKPKTDTAHIEIFFTTKGRDLYCILPAYKPVLQIRDLRVPPNATTEICGIHKVFKIRNNEQGCWIDLSALKPREAPDELLVLKIKNAW